MKTVTVKDLVIGTGAPKIIVSLMAKDIASVKSEALAYREADFDILEWRVDHYADLSNVESVMAAAKILRETMPEKPLLFTFRSAKEGGEQAISTEAYIALNRAAIDSGLVDMIDLELFTGDDQVKETVAYAHAHDVKVVMSNHDFHKTPEAEEIIARLRKMQSFDADIPKIALMPQSTSDVLTLLAATLEMQAQVAESVHREAFAGNLRRAAELIAVPDDRLLEIYNALRPYRSTKQELLDIAGELDGKYGAKTAASLVREAAEVYEKRGRLKKF